MFMKLKLKEIQLTEYFYNNCVYLYVSYIYNKYYIYEIINNVCLLQYVIIIVMVKLIYICLFLQKNYKTYNE